MRAPIDEILCGVARLDMARDILIGCQSDLMTMGVKDVDLERAIRKIQDEIDGLYWIRRDLEKKIDQIRRGRQRGDEKCPGRKRGAADAAKSPIGLIVFWACGP